MIVRRIKYSLLRHKRRAMRLRKESSLPRTRCKNSNKEKFLFSFSALEVGASEDMRDEIRRYDQFPRVSGDCKGISVQGFAFLVPLKLSSRFGRITHLVLNKLEFHSTT